MRPGRVARVCIYGIVNRRAAASAARALCAVLGLRRCCCKFTTCRFIARVQDRLGPLSARPSLRCVDNAAGVEGAGVRVTRPRPRVTRGILHFGGYEAEEAIFVSSTGRNGAGWIRLREFYSLICSARMCVERRWIILLLLKV